MTDREYADRAEAILHAAVGDEDAFVDVAPEVQRVDGGAWVTAYIWVPNEEEDDGPRPSPAARGV